MLPTWAKKLKLRVLPKDRQRLVMVHDELHNVFALSKNVLCKAQFPDVFQQQVQAVRSARSPGDVRKLPLHNATSSLAGGSAVGDDLDDLFRTNLHSAVKKRKLVSMCQ
jgi:hypothetical protein